MNAVILAEALIAQSRGEGGGLGHRDALLRAQNLIEMMRRARPASPVTPEIMLNDGSYYHLHAGRVDGLSIETIAHALSHICRFTGHVRRFYSVAEHCVRASYIDPTLETLMHDAGEALVGDVATPLKLQLDGYEPIETRAETLLSERFGYAFPYSPATKAADRVMLATEKRDLLPKEGRQWKMLALVEPLPGRIPSWALAGFAPYWKRRFIKRFHELGGRA